MYPASAYVWVLWLLTLGLWSEPGWAQSVAIVWAASDSGQTLETATRLRGECLAMGIAVAGVDEREEAAPATPSSRAPTALDATKRPVDAVMDVSATSAVLMVEVWLLVDQPRPSIVATLEELKTTPNAAEKLAIRAAEALHSRLIERELLPVEVTPQRDPPPRLQPQNPVREATLQPASEARQQPLGLVLGGAMLVGTNGLSAAFVPRLQFEWPGASGFFWQASIAGLGTHSRAHTERGAALVSRYYALVGGMYQEKVAFLRPFVGVSIGAMLCAIEGRADAPLQAHDQQRVVALGEVTLGSQVDIATGYYLAFAGHVHVTQPTVAIYVVEERAATAGSPSWVVSLGLGVRL